VLTGLVRDILFFCNEPGAKRNINVVGIAYEKMAVEAQEALAKSRDAGPRGQIEVVGASFG
jgi:hypothetical protein